MATFLRRKLGKVLEKDTTPAILTVQRPEGGVVFTKPEVQRYTWLFTMVDRCAPGDGSGGSACRRRWCCGGRSRARSRRASARAGLGARRDRSSTALWQ
jgi:hypothetical protein